MPSSAKKVDITKIFREEKLSPLYHGIAPEKARFRSANPRIAVEGNGFIVKPPISPHGILQSFKTSCTPEVGDREGAFVLALRRFYRSLPQSVNPKQLIGLCGYGLRYHISDSLNGEPVLKVQSQEGMKPERRYLIGQDIFSGKHIKSLSESESPKELCTGIMNAVTGLLNAYRLGYIHCRITFSNILKCDPQLGYLLAKDGKQIDGDVVEYIGFIKDFTYCFRHEGEDDDKAGELKRPNVCLSTPTHLLVNDDIVHSPVHDLESFLWILIYYIADIVQRFASGQRSFNDECPDLEDSKDLPQLIEEMAFDEDKCKQSTSAGAADNNEDDGDSDDDAKSDATVRKSAKHEVGTESKIAASDDEAMIIDEDHLLKHIDEPRKDRQEHSSQRASKTDRPENEASSEVFGEKPDHKRKPSKQIDKEDGLKRYKSDAKEAEEISKIDYDKAEEDGITGIKDDEPSLKLNSQATVLAHEPVTRDFRTLLEPPLDNHIYSATREMLLEKLDSMISGNICMVPFYPLLCTLRSLAAEYYARSVRLHQEGATFSRDEIEEAFRRYLEAFQPNIPSEEDWRYMKRYMQSLREEYIARHLPGVAEAAKSVR